MWSNLRNLGISLSILLLSILTLSSDGCVKKVATVLQNFPRSTASNGSDVAGKLNISVGTTESPAELANDEAVYTKYSHQTSKTTK